MPLLSIPRAFHLVSLVLVSALAMSLFSVDALSAPATLEAMRIGTPGASIVAEEDGTLRFGPTADAYVVQEKPDENLGDEETLIIDEEPMSVGYIQFEVGGLEQPVDQATLRVWAVNGTRSAPDLWLSPSMSLEEDSVTWTTRPAVDVLVEEGEQQDVSEGSWFEIDVSHVVQGDGAYSFSFTPTSTDGMDIASREANERQPELVLHIRNEESIAPASPEIGEEPILLAAGDIANCDEGSEQTARILDKEIGTIAALGDNAYSEGTAEQFADCYDPTWGRHKDRTMPVPGNHEYDTLNAGPYFTYFGEAAGNPNGGYYSYTLGTWKIIAINTNIGIDDDSLQMRWLREELATNAGRCTLVYGHHPRFSSGVHGANVDIAPVFTTLYNYGVEIYLSGHDHSYERFHAQSPDGERDDAFGVRQFVVGTGGAPLRGFQNPSALSQVRNSDTFGIIRFRLNKDGYQYAFLSVEGSTFYDSGEGTCHDEPARSWVTEVGRIALPEAFVDQYRSLRGESTFQCTTY